MLITVMKLLAILAVVFGVAWLYIRGTTPGYSHKNYHHKDIPMMVRGIFHYDEIKFLKIRAENNESDELVIIKKGNDNDGVYLEFHLEPAPLQQSTYHRLIEKLSALNEDEREITEVEEEGVRSVAVKLANQETEEMVSQYTEAISSVLHLVGIDEGDGFRWFRYY